MNASQLKKGETYHYSKGILSFEKIEYVSEHRKLFLGVIPIGKLYEFRSKDGTTLLLTKQQVQHGVREMV